ncbi:MAG: pyridoxal-phosphate dependent enzyme, partial [Terriglobales bacterium]
MGLCQHLPHGDRRLTKSNATTTDLKLANIEQAASVIDPVFRDSPQFVDEQLCATLGRRTIVKVETANPIRSFKGRGADFLVRTLDPKMKVVCASAGNFGQAIAYAGRSRAMAVEVCVPTDVNPSKLTRMKSLGAMVTIAGADCDAAKQHARRRAREQSGCVFVEDGADPAASEGAGTIGLELLRTGNIDTIVLPVADGALITGVATWVKQQSPETKIIGVCATGAPAMAASWRANRLRRRKPLPSRMELRSVFPSSDPWNECAPSWMTWSSSMTRNCSTQCNWPLPRWALFWSLP